MLGLDLEWEVWTSHSGSGRPDRCLLEGVSEAEARALADELQTCVDGPTPCRRGDVIDDADGWSVWRRR